MTAINNLAGRLQSRFGRNLLIGIPYVWLLLLFFLLPFAMILKISFLKWPWRYRLTPVFLITRMKS